MKSKALKKLFAALSTAALLGSLISPASAASINRVASVPTVDDDTDGNIIQLGVVTLREDDDFPDDFKGGEIFTVTLPTGVKLNDKKLFYNTATKAYYATYADAASASAATDVVSAVEYKQEGDTTWTDLITLGNAKTAGEYTLDITLPGAPDGIVEYIRINPFVEMDGVEAGPVEVTVDSLGSGVTGGTFTIAEVGDGDTTVSVLDKKTVGEGSSYIGTLRISESSVLALGGGTQSFKLRLPKDMSWVTEAAGDDGDAISDNYSGATRINLLGGLSAAGFSDLNAGNPESNFKVENDGRDLIVELNLAPAASRTQKGIIEIRAVVDIDSDAKEGDIEISVLGDDKVDDADVVVGTFADYGIQLKLDSDVETIIAGRNTDTEELETAEIFIKELVPSSVVPNRKTKVTFPGFVKVMGIDVVNNKNVSLDNISFDDNEFEFEFNPTSETSKGEATVKFTISVQADASGDIEAVISGKQGIEGKAVVAKAIAPVSVEAKPIDVKIGVKDQALGDIILTENIKEGLLEGDLELELSDGAKWAEAPKVEVVEGDVDIDEDGVDVKAGDDGNDTVLSIPIDSQSTKASKIKISGGKIDLDRAIPEGAIKLTVKGTAVVENDGDINDTPMGSAGEFGENKNYVTKVQIGNVITPAPDQVKAKTVFTIDSTTFKAGDVEKTMDVAPYIKDGRTFLPVRYVAEALGVNSDNIVWNGATNTVTIIKGDRVVSLVIGSNVLTLNGTQIPMDVAPELTNGRTMLPVRYIAQALGAQISWDEATKTVTVQQ